MTLGERLSARKSKSLLAAAIVVVVGGGAAIGLSLTGTSEPVELPYSTIPSRIIELGLPEDQRGTGEPTRHAGGLIAVDLNGGSARGFIVTEPRSDRQLRQCGTGTLDPRDRSPSDR